MSGEKIVALIILVLMFSIYFGAWIYSIGYKRGKEDAYVTELEKKLRESSDNVVKAL